MSEWNKRKFSEFCDITRGGSPRPIQDFIATLGTPWVKIADATDDQSRYITKTKEFIKPEGELRSRVVFPGDLIVSNSATPGIPRFMKIRACIHDGWLLIRNITGIDELFLYYLLINERETLIMQGNGSIFVNLKTDILKNHIVSIPPLPEQKAIAGVLSSLDDKIDLLHQQNKTLETMAETLFRQWFIEEAEDDWEEAPLSSIAVFLNGIACQKYPPKNANDKLPVLKIKDLRNGISNDCDYASTDIDYKYIVKKGDIIFSWSASLMVKIWYGGECILNQHLFKVTSNTFPKWFIYQWCKQHMNEFISISSSHATTMGHIKRRDLDEALVIIPPDKQLELMTKIIEPLMDKLRTNAEQLETLTSQRDILLPKLMSGDIVVESSERRENE